MGEWRWERRLVNAGCAGRATIHTVASFAPQNRANLATGQRLTSPTGANSVKNSLAERVVIVGTLGTFAALLGAAFLAVLVFA